MNIEEPITFEKIKVYARGYDLLISESSDRKYYLVYRKLPHRVIYLGKRGIGDNDEKHLKELFTYVKRLSRTLDYESTKCA